MTCETRELRVGQQRPSSELRIASFILYKVGSLRMANYYNPCFYFGLLSTRPYGELARPRVNKSRL